MFHPQARLALGTSHTSLSAPEAILMTAVKHLQARLSAALLNPSQCNSGLGKRWRQDTLQAGEQNTFIVALYFLYVAKRLPQCKALVLGREISLWARGRCTTAPNRRGFCLDFHISKNLAMQLKWLNVMSKQYNLLKSKLWLLRRKLCAVWFLFTQFFSVLFKQNSGGVGAKYFLWLSKYGW